METERIKKISWRVGSGLFTAGVVVFGWLVFLAALTQGVTNPLHSSLCLPLQADLAFGRFGYWDCYDSLVAVTWIISFVIAFSMVKATFYYRVREHYAEPFLRWFFQWLTKGKDESERS